MSRELRRVPKDWEHPKRSNGSYQPMFDSDFETRAKEWKEGFLAWYRKDKEVFSYTDPEDFDNYEYWEYEGDPPDREYYMPQWSEEEKTHFQMYETTSEGTPISPVMKSIEELARWLADNNASAFGNSTATYEQWLATCKQGWAMSGVGIPGVGIVSGVEATTILKSGEPETTET